MPQHGIADAYIAIFVVPMMFVIEVLGLFIKHACLAVRLLANMVAGHLVLAGDPGHRRGGSRLAAVRLVRGRADQRVWARRCLELAGIVRRFPAGVCVYLFVGPVYR